VRCPNGDDGRVFRRKPRRFVITASTDDGPKHLYVAAVSKRRAARMARSFLEFVDHGGYRQLVIEVREAEGQPQYGDLGATPVGRAAQEVADVERW
jgi:hypothetical protein